MEILDRIKGARPLGTRAAAVELGPGGHLGKLLDHPRVRGGVLAHVVAPAADVSFLPEDLALAVGIAVADEVPPGGEGDLVGVRRDERGGTVLGKFPCQ